MYCDGAPLNTFMITVVNTRPFPSSLMFGCFAKALSRDVVIDYSELEDIKWFSREDVKTALQGQNSLFQVLRVLKMINFHQNRGIAGARARCYCTPYDACLGTQHQQITNQDSLNQQLGTYFFVVLVVLRHLS